MAHDVFVSYSNEDKAVADSIVAALESNHIRCWYAPRDIKPGQDWGEAIAKAIEESRVFLIIFSSNANRSQRVLDEVNLAIDGEAVLLPFRIENLEPKGAMKLHLSSRHWLDAYEPSWQSHIKMLIQDVSVNLDTEIKGEDIKVPTSITKGEKKPKRKAWIPVSIIVVAILAAAGWFGYPLLNKQISTSTAQQAAIVTQSPEPTVEEEPTPTPLPDWVAEVSEPILTAIQNNSPDFTDYFYKLDDWDYSWYQLHSEVACSSMDGASVEISEGILKVSIAPNCPQLCMRNLKMGQLGNYVLQINFDPKGNSGTTVRFENFFNKDQKELTFLAESSGECRLEQSISGEDYPYDISNQSIEIDNTKTILVTLIHEPPIYLAFLDSTLVFARNDLESNNGLGDLVIMIYGENLTRSIESELDNLKIWDLDKLDLTS